MREEYRAAITANMEDLVRDVNVMDMVEVGIKTPHHAALEGNRGIRKIMKQKEELRLNAIQTQEEIERSTRTIFTPKERDQLLRCTDLNQRAHNGFTLLQEKPDPVYHWFIFYLKSLKHNEIANRIQKKARAMTSREVNGLPVQFCMAPGLYGGIACMMDRLCAEVDVMKMIQTGMHTPIPGPTHDTIFSQSELHSLLQLKDLNQRARIGFRLLCDKPDAVYHWFLYYLHDTGLSEIANDISNFGASSTDHITRKNSAMAQEPAEMTGSGMTLEPRRPPAEVDDVARNRIQHSATDNSCQVQQNFPAKRAARLSRTRRRLIPGRKRGRLENACPYDRNFPNKTPQPGSETGQAIDLAPFKARIIKSLEMFPVQIATRLRVLGYFKKAHCEAIQEATKSGGDESAGLKLYDMITTVDGHPAVMKEALAMTNTLSLYSQIYGDDR